MSNGFLWADADGFMGSVVIQQEDLAGLTLRSHANGDEVDEWDEEEDEEDWVDDDEDDEDWEDDEEDWDDDDDDEWDA